MYITKVNVYYTDIKPDGPFPMVYKISNRYVLRGSSPSYVATIVETDVETKFLKKKETSFMMISKHNNADTVYPIEGAVLPVLKCNIVA